MSDNADLRSAAAAVVSRWQSILYAAPEIREMHEERMNEAITELSAELAKPEKGATP